MCSTHFPNQIESRTNLSINMNTDLDPQRQLARHDRKRGVKQGKKKKDTDLDPNLEPPKDLNLMLRDQLGVGDEIPCEEGC